MSSFFIFLSRSKLIFCLPFSSRRSTSRAGRPSPDIRDARGQATDRVKLCLPGRQRACPCRQELELTRTMKLVVVIEPGRGLCRRRASRAPAARRGLVWSNDTADASGLGNDGATFVDSERPGRWRRDERVLGGRERPGNDGAACADGERSLCVRRRGEYGLGDGGTMSIARRCSERGRGSLVAGRRNGSLPPNGELAISSFTSCMRMTRHSSRTRAA
jgi:hypothetical protein